MGKGIHKGVVMLSKLQVYPHVNDRVHEKNAKMCTYLTHDILLTDSFPFKIYK